MTLDGDSLTLPLPELVPKLASIIGKKLTAYLIAAKDTRAVDRLIEGELLSDDSEPRLRSAYQIVTILSTYDSRAIAQGWLMGLNPELGDRVPISLIREDNLEQLAPHHFGCCKTIHPWSLISTAACRCGPVTRGANSSVR
jgi:uncharacterized protein (DUF2384 family)